MIGPSNVPRPPTSTMKIIFAVQLTPKIESGPSGKRQLFGEDHGARGAAAGAGDDEEDPLAGSTRTPTEAAASSSSRIACSEAPSRLRSSTKSSEEQHRDRAERHPVRVVLAAAAACSGC